MATPGAPELIRTALEAAGAALGDRLIMWKGADLDGRDVDLLALGGAEGELGRLLGERGWTRGPADAGHLVWRPPAGDQPEIDVVPESAWPRWYPPAPEVAARAAPRPGMPAVASDCDLLLIAAADAVGGRPLDKLARRARAARSGLAQARAADAVLARLVEDPDRLLGSARRGRLPWPAAARTAAGSPAARSALRARLGAALRRGRGGGLLVAFSGMDGAGKSTATTAALEAAATGGLPTATTWVRLVDSDTAALERIARPARRLLGHRGRIADTTAVSGPTEVQTTAPRRGPVAFVWVIAIAAITVRSLRVAAGPRRRGRVVVADRWVLDALVDLRVRYGRHPVAEWLLRTLAPRAEVSILLDIDAATAARRKPGDQTIRTLTRMQALYGELAEGLTLERLDARRPAEEVAAEVRAVVARELAA